MKWFWRKTWVQSGELMEVSGTNILCLWVLSAALVFCMEHPAWHIFSNTAATSAVVVIFHRGHKVCEESLSSAAEAKRRLLPGIGWQGSPTPKPQTRLSECERQNPVGTPWLTKRFQVKNQDDKLRERRFSRPIRAVCSSVSNSLAAGPFRTVCLPFSSARGLWPLSFALLFGPVYPVSAACLLRLRCLLSFFNCVVAFERLHEDICCAHCQAAVIPRNPQIVKQLSSTSSTTRVCSGCARSSHVGSKGFQDQGFYLQT